MNVFIYTWIIIIVLDHVSIFIFLPHFVFSWCFRFWTLYQSLEGTLMELSTFLGSFFGYPCHLWSRVFTITMFIIFLTSLYIFFNSFFLWQNKYIHTYYCSIANELRFFLFITFYGESIISGAGNSAFVFLVTMVWIIELKSNEL